VESYALHYDAAGHAVSRTTVTSWGATQVAQSTYTLRGQLELEYAAVNVGQTTGVVAKHTYDAAGREIELTEYFAPGKTESYKYKAYDPETGEMYYDTMYVDVSGWRSHQTKTTYDADGRVNQVSELGRSSISNWYRDAPDPALTALSNVYYSTALGGSGYNSAGMLVTYRYQNLTSGYMHTYTTTYLKRDTYLEQSVKGVSDQQNYQTTTTTSTYDQMGRRVKIVQTTPIKNQSPLTQTRSFSFDASGGILTRRDGGVTQHYVYANGQQVATLGEDGKIDAASQLTAFDSSQMGVEPAMVLEGDTLQGIAQRVYGNGSLWYVLAAANAVTDAELVAGSTLKVPSVKTTANDATTFKPFDPNAIQGSTTPSLPYITPPPKSHCGALGKVIMVVVAVVVTYFTAGAATGAFLSAFGTTTAAAAGTALGVAATAVGGFVGGVVGSIASQAVGSAMGVTSFSWRQVAADGVTTAITMGAGEWLKSTAKIVDGVKQASQFVDQAGKLTVLGRVTQGAINYGGSVVASTVVGRDANFSWNAVAASVVGSFASAKLGGKVPYLEGGDIGGPFGQSLSSGFMNGAINASARRVMGLGKQDWGQLAVDAFGNALGNAAVRGTQVAGTLKSFTPEQRADYDEMVKNGIPRSDALQYATTGAFSPAWLPDGGAVWADGSVTYGVLRPMDDVMMPEDPILLAQVSSDRRRSNAIDFLSGKPETMSDMENPLSNSSPLARVLELARRRDEVRAAWRGDERVLENIMVAYDKSAYSIIGEALPDALRLTGLASLNYSDKYSEMSRMYMRLSVKVVDAGFDWNQESVNTLSAMNDRLLHGMGYVSPQGEFLFTHSDESTRDALRMMLGKERNEVIPSEMILNKQPAPAGASMSDPRGYFERLPGEIDRSDMVLIGSIAQTRPWSEATWNAYAQRQWETTGGSSGSSYDYMLEHIKGDVPPKWQLTKAGQVERSFGVAGAAIDSASSLLSFVSSTKELHDNFISIDVYARKSDMTQRFFELRRYEYNLITQRLDARVPLSNSRLIYKYTSWRP